MTDDLRKLAEAASLTGGWYSACEIAEAIRATVADGTGVDDDAELIAAASPDVVLGLLDRIDMLVRMNLDTEEERDEAREAVRRLAGALEQCETWEEDSGNQRQALRERNASLADPVVRRIVDVCPSCHQHEGNHTIECDNQAQ